MTRSELVATVLRPAEATLGRMSQPSKGCGRPMSPTGRRAPHTHSARVGQKAHDTFHLKIFFFLRNILTGSIKLQEQYSGCLVPVTHIQQLLAGDPVCFLSLCVSVSGVDTVTAAPFQREYRYRDPSHTYAFPRIPQTSTAPHTSKSSHQSEECEVCGHNTVLSLTHSPHSNPWPGDYLQKLWLPLPGPQQSPAAVRLP